MIRMLLIAVLLAVAIAAGRHFSALDPVFDAGLMRPLGYFAQALAIVAVGVLASQLGGNTSLVAPAMFLALMAAGAFLALRGARLPEVDGGVAISVLVLGLVVALLPRPEAWLAMLLAALFGVAHGFRIGVGTPNLARLEAFYAGFLLSSAGLILLGMLVSELLTRLGRSTHGRALFGAAIFGIGAHMMLTRYGLV